MSRQKLNKVLLYCLSIIIFWNSLVAIRAYRFTHFKNKTNTTTLNSNVFGYAMQRFSGPVYYKTPIINFPKQSYQTIILTTKDDLKLEGWYINNTLNKGTVIVCHGFGGNKSTMLNEIDAFYKFGYNVLSFDFRAHGNSEGSACTLGVKEAEDIKLAYEYVMNKGEKNIILFGASMGAATIASCLHQYDIKPSKVILDMPFANYELLMEKFFQKSKYPKQPTMTLFTFWSSVFNKQWFFNMKPSEYVKDIKCPVLLEWGKLDELVPEESTQKIYSNITSKKQLAIYQKSGHGSYCFNEPELWSATVTNFLNN